MPMQAGVVLVMIPAEARNMGKSRTMILPATTELPTMTMARDKSI